MTTAQVLTNGAAEEHRKGFENCLETGADLGRVEAERSDLVLVETDAEEVSVDKWAATAPLGFMTRLPRQNRVNWILRDCPAPAVQLRKCWWEKRARAGLHVNVTGA